MPPRGIDQVLQLANLTLTTAVSGTASTAVVVPLGMRSVVLQAAFTYGSGGTKVTAYVQTSFDGGTTWVDVACFTFTTATATKVSALKAATAVAASYAATDGSLTDDSIKDGILGDRLRVKRTTTGTYGGSTALVVTAVAKT